MKDERIQTTANRIAAEVFAIWFVLMSVSLSYRTLILKQHPRQWWDFAAIYFICLFFGFIANASKGVIDHNFKRLWLTIGITVIIGNTILFFIMGQIKSIAELGAFLIGVIPSVGLVIAVAYFLNRRWKRKAGIEDEK